MNTAPFSKSLIGPQFEHIPLKDMESWATRSKEIRQQEVERKGHISKPLNSFMLYRAAYADRAMLCFDCNHQKVSKLAGLSWGMETQAVKDKYKNIAQVEKLNHLAAHPHYKCSPRQKQQKLGPRIHQRRFKGEALKVLSYDYPQIMQYNSYLSTTQLEMDRDPTNATTNNIDTFNEDLEWYLYLEQ